mmetsp:Transcript_85664/g.170036  ORF Transcript_85664/g.170036 Transcript_85664/m.170036 type:complete len:712 (-) Transcript_85664:138-2273(-)
MLGGVRGESLDLPVMMLHSSHTARCSSTIEPLTALEAETAFSCEGPAFPEVPVRMEGQWLLLGPQKGSNEPPVKVALTLAKVRQSCDGDGTPLLSVENGTDDRIWLVVVLGGAEALLDLMDAVGAAGAIRFDFSSRFKVHHTQIGSGSNAVVYPARTLRSKDQAVRYAAKVARSKEGPKEAKSDSEAKARLGKEVEMEVQMLAAVQGHPNILRFHGLFCGNQKANSPDPNWAVVSELCSAGDLFSAAVRVKYTESMCKPLVRDLLLALAHVHQCGVVHRDVKPENVLMGSNGRPVLSDFGIACKVSDSKEMRRQCGSPGYAAPELLKGRPYGTKIDVFGTGSLFFFCLARKVPFEGKNLTHTLSRTLQCVVDFSMSSVFTCISDECRDMILSLLTKEESDRPSAEKASRQPWLVGGGENARPHRRRHTVSIDGVVQRNLQARGGTAGSVGSVLPEADMATKLPGTTAKLPASCPVTPRQALPPRIPWALAPPLGSTAHAGSPSAASGEPPKRPQSPKTPRWGGSFDNPAQRSRRLRLATGDSMLSSIFGVTLPPGVPSAEAARGETPRPASHRAERRRRTVQIAEDSKLEEPPPHSQSGPPHYQSEKTALPIDIVDAIRAQTPGPQVPHQRSDRHCFTAIKARPSALIGAWSRDTEARQSSRKSISGNSASTRASSSNSTSTPKTTARPLAGSDSHQLNSEDDRKSPRPRS